MMGMAVIAVTTPQEIEPDALQLFLPLPMPALLIRTITFLRGRANAC